MMPQDRPDATIPGQFPTQDGIDRADHIAVEMSISIDPAEYQSADFDWQLLPTIRPDYNAWITEAIQNLADDAQLSHSTIHAQTTHYQVGPASGGMIDNIQQITTLVGIASDAFTVVSGAIWLRRLMAQVKSKAQTWSDTQPVDSLSVHAAYTPLVLKHMCLGYLADFHGIETNGPTSIECTSTEFYDGYSSPAHPTAMLEYLVVIPHSQEIYTFRLRGDSEILSLKRTKVGYEQEMPTMKYLDDTFAVEAQNDPNIPE